MKHFKISRLTIRARLTLVYGGLFLVAGVLLLGVTYVLVSQRLPHGGATVNDSAGQPSGTLQQDGLPVPDSTARTPAIEQTFVAEVRGDALDALLTQGGIALGVAGAAAIALGWLIAGRVLQPLHRVTETARRIADAPPPTAACTSGSRCTARRTRSRSWRTRST